MRAFVRNLSAVLATAASLLPAAWGSIPEHDTSWSFWTQYADRFISPEGRVIDPDRESMTTSEGQSYAMFFALVAGDVSMFERLRHWTEVNLAKGEMGRNLPSWSWGSSGGNWRVLDPHSASDSDLWIAYDLLQAGELWKNPSYTEQGNAMLRQIAEAEVAQVPKYGPVLLPGAGFQPDADHWILNPSYLPPTLLSAAAHADPSGPWKTMAANLPSLLKDSSPDGFALDWVQYSSAGTFVPASGPDNGRAPCGSYDAIRVYLWIGLDSSEDPSRAALLKTFTPMRTLLRAHPLPPESVAPDGESAGVGPLGFSAALVPFLWAMPDPLLAGEQQRRMEAGFNPKTGLLGTPARYYDQNLALFATAWQQKRFRFAGDGSLRVSWKR